MPVAKRFYLLSVVQKTDAVCGEHSYSSKSLVCKEFESEQARDNVGLMSAKSCRAALAAGRAGQPLLALNTQGQSLDVVQLVPNEDEPIEAGAADDCPADDLKRHARFIKAKRRGEPILYMVEVWPDCDSGIVKRYFKSESDTLEGAAMDYADSIPGEVVEIEALADGSFKAELTFKMESADE